MDGIKNYLQPADMVVSAILDIVEMQNGKITFSDTPHGIIHYYVRMYGAKWEMKFSVTDIGENRCSVKLEIGDEVKSKERIIKRQFAFLDSILIVYSSEVQISEKTGNE